jgi:glycosyltransferase involved in cell wall biosynthesis
MKILLDCQMPFQLAHGGAQVQIERTKQALEAIGVEVDWLRWWDRLQVADVIHVIGRPPSEYVDYARDKGIKVVVAELLTGLGSRPAPARRVQKALIAVAQGVLPKSFSARMAWRSYKTADACVALTPWEAQLMVEMFGAPRERVHVIANGVEEVFLQSAPAVRGPWLVCTATVTERKRVLELGEAAVLAQTPLWVIGQPYTEGDPYARSFADLARKNSTVLRYEGAISDRARLAQIYREARGFVLLSTMESLSLSALEAVACGCPLLLTDLPWARSVFGAKASYCPIAAPQPTAAELRRFYDSAPALPIPPRPASWTEIAGQFRQLYTGLLARPSTSS